VANSNSIGKHGNDSLIYLMTNKFCEGTDSCRDAIGMAAIGMGFPYVQALCGCNGYCAERGHVGPWL